MTIAIVEKLNKGTSRDEWGKLKYWGFKAPNGEIRARVSAGGHLEVKNFDPAAYTGYRNKPDWETAQSIGSSFITIAEADEAKGPNSKDIVPEVNAIIEGYNDALAKWKGRKVVGHYIQKDEIMLEVDNVIVNFDQNAVLSTILTGQKVGQGYGKHTIFAENARELQVDDFRGDFERAIEAEKARIRKGNEFLQKAITAAEYGKTLSDPGGYTVQGTVSGREASNIIRLVNELAALRSPATT